MTFSKNSLAVKLMLAAALLISAGCSTESNKAKDVGFNEPNRFPGEGNFRVDALTAKSTINAEYNDYAILTKKTFNLEACIKDPLYAAVQAALAFAIVDGAGNERVLYTDSRGCLNWSETHSFKFFADETYIKMKRRVESRNFYKGYALVEVYLNPWLDGAAAVLDPRYNELPLNAPVVEMSNLSMKGQELSPSGLRNVQVNLKSVAFDFLGQDFKNYEVSPMLGLQIAQKYNFRISPSILRKTISKLVVPEVLNTGSMKAILVLLKEDPNMTTQFTAKNVVSSTEFEGKLIAGDLVGEVSIKSSRIADLTSRTLALITLVPKSNLDGFPKVSFIGPVAPGTLKAVNLIPSDKDATSLHQASVDEEKVIKEQKVKPLEIFAKASGFKPLSTRMQSYAGLLDEVTQKQDLSLISRYSFSRLQFKTDLCREVLGSNPKLARLMDDCRVIPLNFLDVGVRTFAEKILSAAPEVDLKATTIDTFKMVSSNSASVTDSTSLGYNLKAGLNGSVNLTGGLSKEWVPKDTTYFGHAASGKSGASLGFNFSVGGEFAHSRVVKNDRLESVSSTREQSVRAESLTLKFDAEVRHCLLIKPSSRLRQFLTEDEFNELGRYRCLAQTQKENRKEVYYLLTSSTGVDGSPITDNASWTSTPWRMLIRGTHMRNMFEELVSTGLFQFIFSPQKLGLESQEKYLETIRKNHQTEEFPGLLSNE